MKKYALCVTVYKNRQKRLVNYLPNIDKKYDVYIVAQDNDPAKNEYQEYCTQNNIKVLICDGKNLEEKRHYILNKMRELKYNGFFILDDDIIPEACVKIDKNIKRTTSDSLLKMRCSMNELLDVCIERSNKYNVGICGFINQAFMGYSKARECVINKSFTQYCFVYFNLNLIPSNVEYDTTGTVHSDLDIVCQTLQEGVNIGTIETHSYNFVYGQTTLTINGEPAEFVYKCRTAHKWHIPLYCRNVKNSDDPKVYLRFKPEMYYNTKVLPPVQSEIIDKLYEQEKYKEVYNYLKEMHSNKNKKK